MRNNEISYEWGESDGNRIEKEETFFIHRKHNPALVREPRGFQYLSIQEKH